MNTRKAPHRQEEGPLSNHIPVPTDRVAQVELITGPNIMRDGTWADFACSCGRQYRLIGGGHWNPGRSLGLVTASVLDFGSVVWYPPVVCPRCASALPGAGSDCPDCAAADREEYDHDE